MPEDQNGGVAGLLEQTGRIIEKYESLSRETGEDFNIFAIANISTNERAMCRVLCEMLSPKGSHGQGADYLALFLRECLGMDFGDDDLAGASVFREYPADGRWIDLVILIGDRFIPIEVKINAEEQYLQCYAYYQFACKRDKETQVVYLTKYGDPPQPYSAEGLTITEDGYEEVKTISFHSHIYGWLKQCLAMLESERKAPVREVLKQLITTVMGFTNQLEDITMKEIQDLLSKSEESIRHAYAITDALAVCEGEMRKRFFDAFCARFACNGQPDKITLDSEYDIREESWPGVSYTIKPEIEPGITLSFYLQIHNRDPLCAGFHFIRGGEVINEDLETMQRLTRYFTGITPKDSKEWAIFQEYIQVDGEMIPLMRIRSGDLNYFKLFDQEKFDRIVAGAVKQVEAMFARLKA
ncbi:MAG: PD-(D/E)XK nuclease family protein [Clostridiales bacterium]|nr:PD-(D/E)XK nuclease family protein [Clostridiales bacterium]